MRRIGAPLAALAMVFQCLVIQSHVDGVALLRLADDAAFSQAHAAVVEAAAPEGERRDGHRLAPCVICQAAAIGSAAFLGGTSPALAVQVTTFVNTPAPAAPSLRPTPSHTWRSRGPPILAV